MSRASDRAARRAAATGSGHTHDDAAGQARFPGAKSAFGLLGEVLVIGVLIAVVSLPIITLPAALAAGVRHLRRFLAADDSGLAWFWRDVRAALLGGTALGAASALVALILVLDIDLAGSGVLPGGQFIAVVGWVGLAALALALFAASGRWTPETGWLASLKAVPGVLRADLAGAGYLLATAVFAVVVTWQLFPLVIPALGCIALAIVAVPERPRRRGIDSADAGRDGARDGDGDA